MIESNQRIQTNSNGRGGAREGAGRKKSALTVKTRDIATVLASNGMTPLEYLISVMRNETSDPKERMIAAQSAAPYIHAKLSSIELGGPDGEEIPVAHRITLASL